MSTLPHCARGHVTGTALRPRVLHAAAPGALIVVIAIFLGVDLATDLNRNEHGLHIIGEVVGIAVSLLGFAVMWWLLASATMQARELATALVRSQADLLRWRSDSARMLQDLGDQLDQHFAAVDLSPGERDVALLLLKGLSLHEIAGARDSRERIVRRQAEAIFRKANVTGQEELAAFFLEALLLPLAPSDTALAAQMAAENARNDRS